MTFSFLISFGGPDMRFMPKIDEYWSFYSWFLLGLGLVFQIPVIIFVLARIGLVTPGFLLRGWKFAILGSFIVSAVVTPTPDVVNADRARRPDDRALPARRPGGVGVREEAAGGVGRDGGQRGSSKLTAAPRTTFSRRACPEVISITHDARRIGW